MLPARFWQQLLPVLLAAAVVVALRSLLLVLFQVLFSVATDSNPENHSGGRRAQLPWTYMEATTAVEPSGVANSGVTSSAIIEDPLTN